jgi:peroxiredoxin (alkyl hydroperoxide reductase subunit C)
MPDSVPTNPLLPKPGPSQPSPLVRLGETVPNFSARSTTGPLSLADFRGSWLVLFSHPGDFTPVCTSEFVALARAAPRFAAFGCALVGVSVDSLFSHLAWIRMIRDRFGVNVEFPIVEDPTMAIAHAYGMVAPDAIDASSARATCFIDPDGILRAQTNYPATVGRSVAEMLRIVAALRRVQDGSVLAPEGWVPGADLLRTPAETARAALTGTEPSDWFYQPVPDPEGR